uniref:Integrase catalytic domain-containing protein n=1 Tax=Ascaris lumbricoides TaxID=6252 RepID=A0A0M3IF98_ASCLU
RLVRELTCRTPPKQEKKGENLGQELIVAPGILIGSDFYWQLIGSGAPERLANNLYRISTKVGPMIGGRLVEEKEIHSDCGVNVIGGASNAEDRWAEVEKFWKLESIGTYRFTRVAFGVVASPFLLGATLRFHLDKVAREAKEQDKEKAERSRALTEQIKENTYVDNVVLSAETPKEAVETYHAAKTIFDKASMNLRQWASNDTYVTSQFQETDLMPEGTTNVLGLGWDRQEDTLTVRLAVKDRNEDVVLTKRRVLSHLSANFDPLGLIAPVLLKGKLFFQTLWKEGYQWDEILKPEHRVSWTNIVTNWKEYHTFVTERRVIRSGSKGLQLHAFVDASQHAFAAAIYLRSEGTRKIESHLVFSKTRLSPLRDISIPRLELMACVIGVRALTYVEKQLKVAIEKKVLWSDSKCALAWISSSRALPIFVANRVQELNKQDGIVYRHVGGKENPADLASRGVNPKALANNNIWWKGPDWLVETEEKWPLGNDQMKGEVEKKDMISSVLATQTTLERDHEKEEDWLNKVAARVSTWRKLKGVIGYALRWRRIKNEVRHQHAMLSMEELQCAERKIMDVMQSKHFHELREALQHNKPHQLRRQLGVIEIDGLLRCKGRYEQEDLPAHTKWPILVPSKCRVTELIVEEAHKKNFHHGLQKTLCDVRERFWIPKGRAVVKRVLRRCPTCKKYEGGPFMLPPMPALPAYRIRRAFPFQHTGVDYFGPMLTKDKGQTTKIWGCLWTCLVTRAVHLDTVSSLLAEQFIQTFRRFVARRGMPERILSDNATTFTSAGKILVSEHQKKELNEGLAQYGSENGLRWDFITSHAPWKGGAYERMIGLLKRSLSKTLGRKVLRIEELQTLLCEIEAILNSRPITYVYESIHEGKAIRPIDFFSPNVDLLISSSEDKDELSDPSYRPESEINALQEKYRVSLYVLDDFWRRWRDEYLLSLREQQKMEHLNPRNAVVREPEVGEVVIIYEEIVPRGQWKTGIITCINRSEDNQIRKVVLKTITGENLERPINHLYPLELKACEQREKKKGNDPQTHRSQPENSSNWVLRSRIVQKKAVGRSN